MAVWMIRHGETEWSLSGRHTGSTDVPLTTEGELQARAIGRLLGGRAFGTVRSSPLRRARDTAHLAGYGDRLELTGDLHEVDYGEYEGLTTAQIWERRPDWELFRDGCPGGETPEQISARMDRIRERFLERDEHVLLFGHGHSFRALAVRYLGLPVRAAAQVRLDPGSLSILSMERDGPTLVLWNRRVPPRAVLVAESASRVPEVP